MEDDHAEDQQDSELDIEMLPIALAALIVELREARRLAGELAELTPAQADSSWCEQLEDEYDDVEARRARMARQLARWRLDHPHAAGLDELADRIAEVEPVRQALMRELARLRCASGESGTWGRPGDPEQR